MTMNIQQGQFSQIVKSGVYFSIEGDDRVFTGDLYFDFALKEFQLRGIPSFQGRMRHVLDPAFKGPVTIDLFVKTVIEKGPRDMDNYSDLKFRSAKVSSQLATWIEEWFGDKSVMHAIEEFWEVVRDLTWFKQ